MGFANTGTLFNLSAVHQRLGRAQREQAAEDHEGREHIHARIVRGGDLLEPAHRIGAQEAREIADRVDQCDAGSRAGAREPRRGQAPEQRQRGENADGGDRERRHCEQGVVRPRDRKDEAERADRRRNRDVPAAFAHAVGASRGEQHADHGRRERNRREQADRERVLHARRLDDGGQPEAHAVEAHHEREVSEAHHEHARAGEHSGKRKVFLGGVPPAAE